MCNNEYTGQATKFPSMFMELCSISEYHLEHNSWLVILQMFFKIQNWCVKQKKIIYNVKIDIMEKGKFWSKLKKKKKNLLKRAWIFKSSWAPRWQLSLGQSDTNLLTFPLL
jgi:hypothetical protein